MTRFAISICPNGKLKINQFISQQNFRFGQLSFSRRQHEFSGHPSRATRFSVMLAISPLLPCCLRSSLATLSGVSWPRYLLVYVFVICNPRVTLVSEKTSSVLVTCLLALNPGNIVDLTNTMNLRIVSYSCDTNTIPHVHQPCCAIYVIQVKWHVVIVPCRLTMNVMGAVMSRYFCGIGFASILIPYRDFFSGWFWCMYWLINPYSS